MIISKYAKTALAAMAATLAGAVLAQPAEPPSVFASTAARLARPPRIDANDPACRPVHPAQALATPLQGESHLRFRVDANGRLVSGQMLRNADAPPEQRMLDVAALQALSRCPITPGIDAEGKLVGGDVDVTYHWVLDAPPAAGEGRIQGMTPSCRPEYPPAAVRSGAQGTTGLAFHVDETGKVTGVDIVKRSGDTREHHLLDAAAAHFLSMCPVQPARDADGKPVASVVKVTYTWRLE